MPTPVRVAPIPQPAAPQPSARPARDTSGADDRPSGFEAQVAATRRVDDARATDRANDRAADRTDRAKAAGGKSSTDQTDSTDAKKADADKDDKADKDATDATAGAALALLVQNGLTAGATGQGALASPASLGAVPGGSAATDGEIDGVDAAKAKGPGATLPGSATLDPLAGSGAAGTGTDAFGDAKGLDGKTLDGAAAQLLAGQNGAAGKSGDADKTAAATTAAGSGTDTTTAKTTTGATPADPTQTAAATPTSGTATTAAGTAPSTQAATAAAQAADTAAKDAATASTQATRPTATAVTAAADSGLRSIVARRVEGPVKAKEGDNGAQPNAGTTTTGPATTTAKDGSAPLDQAIVPSTDATKAQAGTAPAQAAGTNAGATPDPTAVLAQQDARRRDDDAKTGNASDAATPVGQIGAPAGSGHARAADATTTTAQAAAAATTSHAVDTAALASSIATHAKDGHSRFEIRLDPPELGRVDVKLKVGSDGEVRAHLIVERSETLDMMMRDQRGLERALENAGLKTDGSGLQFSLRDQGSGNQTNQGWRSYDAQSLSGRTAAAEDDSSIAAARAAVYGARTRAGGLDLRV